MAFATKYDQVTRELAETKEAERKIKIQSLLYTFLVMLVLAALIILWFKIPPQNPPMPDALGGMDVIEGTDLTGMNPVNESVAAGAPQKTEAQPIPTPPVPVADPPSTPDGDVAVKKAPDKPQPKTDIKPTTVTPKTTAPPERKPDNRFNLDNGKTNGANGPGGTATSKGTGYVPGNQGNPNGNPDGKDWYGPPGDGTGKGIHLAHRSAQSLPEPDCNNQKEGKDIVRIKVDNNGRVIEAKGGMRGSAITDAVTIQCDEIAARKAKFNVDPNAPAVQEGTIVYIHKLQ